MYLKVCPAYKGKIYLSFVQGYRDEDGKVKQKTIKKIGYLDDLKKIYDDPIAHFKEEAKRTNADDITKLIINNLNDKELVLDEKQKNLGYIIIKKIYSELGIDDFLKNKQKNINAKFNINKIFSLLIFSRILSPTSKKETYENKDTYFENFDFSYDDMMRALDYFKDYKEELELLLWNKTKELYKRDISKTYYDCTNYYFEIEYNDNDKFDDNGNLIKSGYRKRGPEKNHRPDPIIEMGLLMDASGIPIAYNLFPGNESEKSSLIPEINRLKNKFNFDRTIVVADRGLNCSDNIIKIAGMSIEDSLKKNGYVYGQSVRGADEEFKQWVLDEKGYKVDEIIDSNVKILFKHKSRIYPKKMYVKRTDKGKTKKGNIKKQSILVDQKQMVYYSQKYANKQKHDRDMMIQKAKDLINNPNKYTKATSYGAANYVKNLSFVGDTGEIADKTNLLLDEEKIKEEEKFDGYYSIVTSEEKLSDIEIRNIYRGLSKTEETFKVTKSELETRPVYVWTSEHIEAHFLTCLISLVIMRLMENKLDNKFSTKAIIKSLKEYKSSKVENDIYMQNNYTKIIQLFNELYNLNLNKKYMTLSKIKKILNF